jgi:NAD(P)-dependent dehydrogenase (short-subunit alcohol dehydrogenase family)
MGKLKGKVAVITGGNSGIGLATAKRFVEEGANVVITGRREKDLKEAAAFIGRNVTTVAGDVSNLEDLDRLYAVVKEKHGHIDILFANAGGGTVAPLATATESHFDKIFDVNVKGLILYRAKSSSPFQRWRLDHPNLFERKRTGCASLYRLRRQQGSRAQLRSRLDDGAKGSQDSGEFNESWPNRNSGFGEGGPHR